MVTIVSKCTHGFLLSPFERTAIVPNSPDITKPNGGDGDKRLTQRRRYLTFTQAFDVFGLPLLLVALACLCWTIWLLILAIAPNATANYLMNTESFDNGSFWLITDPNPVLTVCNVIGLGMVLLGYSHALAKMTLLRYVTISPSTEQRKPSTAGNHLLMHGDGLKQKALWIEYRLWMYWKDLTSLHGHYRKFWNLWFKLVDFSFQIAMLHQILEAGFPIKLIGGYVVLLCANIFTYAFAILSPRYHSALSEVLLDMCFDLLFAIVFPICVLAYSYTNFHFDRASYALNLEVFSPGEFETHARMNADITQIALFRAIFDGLRICSILDLLLRIGLNLSFYYRLKRVIDVLMTTDLNGQPRRWRIMSIKTAPTSNGNNSTSSAATTSRNVSQQKQQRVPRWFALILLAFGTGVIVITHQSIRLSQSKCAAHQECVIYAYQWWLNEAASCPCLTLIDANQSPQSYEEWINPKNVTDKVRELAASGKLRTLVLINRRFSEWPEEFQRCTNLQHLALVYTKSKIPAWAAVFHKLEYLHIEGIIGDSDVRLFPDDLFRSMSMLAWIHIGGFVHLQRLPSFKGLTNLKMMDLGVLTSVEELPSFEPLEQLELMILVDMEALRTIPDTAPLKHLQALKIFFPSPICCIGFLRDAGFLCDETHPYCNGSIFAGNVTLDRATCLSSSEATATSATLATLSQDINEYCVTIASLYHLEYVQFPRGEQKVNADACKDKALYHPCAVPGRANITGICYHTRLQVLACTDNDRAIEMRRRQIQRHIGLPCDPKFESLWGCVAATSSS